MGIIRRYWSSPGVRLVVVAVLALAVIAGIIIAARPGAPAPELDVSAVTPTPEAEPTARVRSHDISETSAAPPYTVTGNYPEIEGLADKEGAAALNAYLQAQFMAALDEFKGNAGEFAGAPDGTQSELRIEAHVALAGPRYVSGWFDVTEYYAGAAHPASFYRTFNYDITAPSAMQLDDLFTSGSNYLPVIAAQARAELERELGAEGIVVDNTFRTGTAPAAENYQFFFFTDETLEIVFNPYRIASGAAGIRTAAIPWEALRAFRR
ncbi:MAG: DUF3298 domain-containing protein [bacterium]|nr:DUF3298 domain-containing protein [bacterium]MDZ4296299.1 DUF3298 domain-containing protein [Patescibacteria group bacterium]